MVLRRQLNRQRRGAAKPLKTLDLKASLINGATLLVTTSWHLPAFRHCDHVSRPNTSVICNVRLVSED
jgi:hypothetical protein